MVYIIGVVQMDRNPEEVICASDDLISKLIERYHEEKLDRRDKGSPPGAGAAGIRGLLAQMLYLN